MNYEIKKYIAETQDCWTARILNRNGTKTGTKIPFCLLGLHVIIQAQRDGAEVTSQVCEINALLKRQHEYRTTTKRHWIPNDSTCCPPHISRWGKHFQRIVSVCGLFSDIIKPRHCFPHICEFTEWVKWASLKLWKVGQEESNSIIRLITFSWEVNLHE